MYRSSAIIGLGVALHAGLSSAQGSYPPKYYNGTEPHLETNSIADPSFDVTSDWNEEELTAMLADNTVTVTAGATTVFVDEELGNPLPVPSPTIDLENQYSVLASIMNQEDPGQLSERSTALETVLTAPNVFLTTTEVESTLTTTTGDMEMVYAQDYDELMAVEESLPVMSLPPPIFEMATFTDNLGTTASFTSVETTVVVKTLPPVIETKMGPTVVKTIQLPTKYHTVYLPTVTHVITARPSIKVITKAPVYRTIYHRVIRTGPRRVITIRRRRHHHHHDDHHDETTMDTMHSLLSSDTTQGGLVPTTPVASTSSPDQQTPTMNTNVQPISNLDSSSAPPPHLREPTITIQLWHYIEQQQFITCI